MLGAHSGGHLAALHGRCTQGMILKVANFWLCKRAGALQNEILQVATLKVCCHVQAHCCRSSLQLYSIQLGEAANF